VQAGKARSIPEASKPTPLEPRELRPEFFRLPKGDAGEVDAFFGLSRSYYYMLERRGQLKLHRLLSPGREKGIVLVRFSDVSAFVESQITQRQEAIAR
jgi:hypothetical protein